MSTRYPRGTALTFSMTYFALDVWRGCAHEALLLVWDQQRVDRGVPSIFG